MSVFARNTIITTLLILVFTVLISYLLLRLNNKDGTIRNKYDERQKIIRGNGYRIAFYFLVFLELLNVFLENCGIKIPIDHTVKAFLVILFSLTVHVVYCIFHDAYISLNVNTSVLYIEFVVIAIINFALGISHIIDGSMIQNGMLGKSVINLACGIIFLIIFLALFIKRCMNKMEDNEAGTEDNDDFGKA